MPGNTGNLKSEEVRLATLQESVYIAGIAVTRAARVDSFCYHGNRNN